MMLYGFTSGCAAFMAQFFGAGDLKSIRKTTGFAATVTISVSLVFFMIAMFVPQLVLGIFTRFPVIINMGTGYIRLAAGTFLCIAVTVPLTSALRATQQTRIPLYISGTAFCLNSFLNIVLIFGYLGAPAMGIRGTALATLIARFTEMSLLLFVVFVRKNKIAGPLKEFFSYNRELAGKIVRNALPTTVNETMWAAGTSLYIAAFARIGITEGAAVQAGNVINNLFTMAAFSIGDATLILVGQRLGQGQLTYAYELAKKLLKVGAGIGLILGTGLILSSRPVLTLFNFSPLGSHLTFCILLVYGGTMWLVIYNCIQITGTLRCGGDARFAMTAELCTVWFIGVPMAFFTTMVLHWPVYFAVLAVKSEEMVKSVIITRRFLSKKWVKNIISGS